MSRALTIRETAAATGTTAHTLRYYERIGLMCDVPRTASGHRRYGPEEIRWIEFVRRMHQTGMSIQRMLEYARLFRAGDGTIPARRRLLDAHRRMVAARVDQLRESLTLIDAKLRSYVRWERTAAGRRRRERDNPEMRLYRGALANPAPRALRSAARR